MKTTTIRISEELHKELRAMSDATGVPVKRLADRAVTAMLKEWHTPLPDNDPFFIFGEWAAANGFDLDDHDQRAEAVERYGKEKE